MCWPIEWRNMAFRRNRAEVPLPPADRDQQGLLKKLLSIEIILVVWIPVAATTLAHYFTPHSYHWVHDILRRAYYLPIVVAALRAGLAGGLITASLVTLVYIPHAFLAHAFMGHFHLDPAGGLEKFLEITLYFGVAGIAGYLSGLEKKRRSQLRDALEEQQSLTEQLVRAGRLSTLGEVVAGIAHEIRNPLHSLKGTAEIVDSVIPEADERRMWEIHRREIDHLDRVAEQFLSFAKPTPVTLEALDLRVVARRVMELLEADARKRNIETELVLKEEVPATGDIDQLAQVGLNIALNAVRAIGDASGTIRITVGKKTHHQNKEMAVLSIENSGPKIPDEELEHLFDPFHSNTGGTGLGLSISSRIAEQHGGFLEIEEGDLGVVFSLYLPRRISK